MAIQNKVMLRISPLGQDKVTTDKNHYTDNADMDETHRLTLPPGETASTHVENKGTLQFVERVIK